jgi:hypothetical protein
MTILIILASWILVLSLVIGLCLAARLGDAQSEAASPTPRRRSAQSEQGAPALHQMFTLARPALWSMYRGALAASPCPASGSEQPSSGAQTRT